MIGKNNLSLVTLILTILGGKFGAIKRITSPNDTLLPEVQGSQKLAEQLKVLGPYIDEICTCPIDLFEKAP